MCKNDSLLTVTRIQFILMRIVIRMFFKNVQSSGYAKLEKGDRSSANVLQTGRWVTIQVVTWMLQTQRSSATNTLIFKNLKLSKLLHQSTVPIVVSVELSVEKRFVYNFLLSSILYSRVERPGDLLQGVANTFARWRHTHHLNRIFIFCSLNLCKILFYILNLIKLFIFCSQPCQIFSFFYSQPTWVFSSTYLDLYCFFICYSPLSWVFLFFICNLTNSFIFYSQPY